MGKSGRFAGVSAGDKATVLEMERGEKEQNKLLNELSKEIHDFFAPHGAKDPHYEDLQTTGELDMNADNVRYFEDTLTGGKDDGQVTSWGEAYGADEQGYADDQLDMKIKDVERWMSNLMKKSEEAKKLTSSEKSQINVANQLMVAPKGTELTKKDQKTLVDILAEKLTKYGDRFGVSRPKKIKVE